MTAEEEIAIIENAMLVAMLAGICETNKSGLIEHVQACYGAMRLAIGNPHLREMVAGKGERPATLQGATRMFAKVFCHEQCQHALWMKGYIDATRQLEDLQKRGCPCRPCRPRPRGRKR